MEHNPAQEHPEAPAHQEPSVSRNASPTPNKVERIAGQSRRLVEDVKSWVDLKIKHTKLEILELLDEKKEAVLEQLEPMKKDALIGGIALFLALVGLVFLLIAAALFLGTWLGHAGWGFLVVTGGLLTISALMAYFRFGREKRKKAVTEAAQNGQLPASATPQLPGESERKQLTPG